MKPGRLCCGDIKTVAYVALPKTLLKACGLFSEVDLMLYSRPQVHELWGVLEDVIERGFIAGPPGTSESVSTLNFAASLNRQIMRVIWT
ncbi:hypothetical protein JG688_00017802 [Phytophthora aleatoria]|uniref:Uncharacterized protein n=1 Tax=Phytophthora aleatoria TaxID=2496075 RepID=A0A8J5IQB3_9STRA|nr:hypothetical protein JG688_00017802 [Phytophthora aleatoria]